MSQQRDDRGERVCTTRLARARFGMLGLLLSSAFASAPPVLAQIVADPAAPANQQPNVTQDSIGRPLVNIQTPSPQGLSRNTYKQFDVPTGGAGLNNAPGSNPLLNGTPAKTILNEVNSADPSRFNGALTVHGAPAHVIIANPNGIVVNGGGFINATRATLTTGTAQVKDGMLSGFAVKGGEITIAPGGLNSSATPYTDIISRSLKVLGDIQAQGLGITTGLQTVAADTGELSAQSGANGPNGTDGTNTRPKMAIDTASLGGMYAQVISIVATEAGLGVRNEGTWQAAGGQVHVSANGLVINTGAIGARVTTVAAAGPLANRGYLQADQALVLSSGSDVMLAGMGMRQNAPTDVAVNAKGAVSVGTPELGQFWFPVHISSAAPGGQISIRADGDVHLAPGSSVDAHGPVRLDSGATLWIQGARARSEDAQVRGLGAKAVRVLDGTVQGRQVHLEARPTFEDAPADLVLRYGQVRGEEQTTLLASHDLGVRGRGNTVLSSGGDVYVQADHDLTVARDSRLAADANLSLLAGRKLVLDAGGGMTPDNGQFVTLDAGADLHLESDTMAAVGSKLHAGGDLELQARQGDIYLESLPNVWGTAVDPIEFEAGRDLRVSALDGGLWASGLQARGRDVVVLANGMVSLANTVTAGEQGQLKPVPSVVSAREDLVLGSIQAPNNHGYQTQIIASRLEAGGHAEVFANGWTFLGVVAAGRPGRVSPWGDTLIPSIAAGFGVKSISPSLHLTPLVDARTPRVPGADWLVASASPDASGEALLRSSITAGSLALRGGRVEAVSADLRADGDHSSSARSGDLSVTATKGPLVLHAHDEQQLPRLSSAGNMALHAEQDLRHLGTRAEAKGSLSSTSATGGIHSLAADLRAQDALILNSRGAQTHTGSAYRAGAASIHNQSGHLQLDGTRVVSYATVIPALDAISGHTSIESGGTLTIDPDSVIAGQRELSIIQGQGDIVINSLNAPRGTFGLRQILTAPNLILATRSGNLTLTGSPGPTGLGSSTRVNVRFPDGGLKLVADNVTLQGSALQTDHRLDITATKGNLTVHGLQTERGVAHGIESRPDQATLSGSGGLALRAAGDIHLSGFGAYSGNGAIQIEAGGSVVIGTEPLHIVRDNRPDGWFQDEHHAFRSLLDGQQGVQVNAAGGNLSLTATDVRAAAGPVTLRALGSVGLQAAEQRTLHHRQQTGWQTREFFLFERRTDWTDYFHNESLHYQPVVVTGQDIELKAGESIETFATRLEASRNLTVQAGTALNYYALQDQRHNTARRDSRSDVGLLATPMLRVGGDSSTNEHFEIQARPAELQSQQDILSQSGADQLLQGTRVRYGGTATFEAGVGEKAKAEARLILEGVKEGTAHTLRREANDVLWQQVADAGQVQESLLLPSFSGPQAPRLEAPGGVQAQVPEGDLKGRVEALSQQPGLGYLKDLAARPDVNWEPVELALKQWDEQQSGLTPAGAALLAVAVTWALGPDGAGIIGGGRGATAAMMGDAAIASLSSQASIALINNKGDVAKTLETLASSQSAKAAIAAALSAGVLSQVGNAPAVASLAAGSVAEKAAFNLINAGGRSLTQTAIQGGDLEDALEAALIGGVVDTLHGEAASAIKGLEAHYLAHKVAHAVAGCAAGAAAGGHCGEGAIGAAVGEIVAQAFTQPSGDRQSDKALWDAYDAKVLAYSKLLAGTAAAYSGGDAQAAITAAETAVRNNYLTELQKRNRDLELAACSSVACSAGVRMKYGGVNAAQNAGLLIGFGGGIGYQSWEQGTALLEMLKDVPGTLDTLTAILSDSEVRARIAPALLEEYGARIATMRQGYEDGGWGGSVTAGVEFGRLSVDVLAAAQLGVGGAKVLAVATKAAASGARKAVNLAAVKFTGPAGAGSESAATVFKTMHYASRLESEGVNVASAEHAVAKEVSAIRGSMEINADTAGRLEIDGILVEYRARLLADGTVNIGTIFPVK